MVNLLPISEKMRIRKMYKSRLFVVALLFLAAVAGAGIIALTPTFFWSFVKEKAAYERLAVVSQIVSSEERKNLREDVVAVNKRIAVLVGEDIARVAPSFAIEKIIARKNSGVALVSFFYGKEGGALPEKSIMVSGISQNRQMLLDFIHELQKEPAFSEVNVPVSNFVKSSAIPFSISLILNDNENIE